MQVRVLANTPVFGLRQGEQAVLESSPLIERAVQSGYLTILGTSGEVLEAILVHPDPEPGRSFNRG